MTVEDGAARARGQHAAAWLGLSWDCTVLRDHEQWRAERDGVVVGVIAIYPGGASAPGQEDVLALSGDEQADLVTRAHRYGAKAAIVAWHFPGQIRWIDVLGPSWRPWPIADHAYQVPVYECGLIDTTMAPPPTRDAAEGSGFYCELCHGTHPLSELASCPGPMPAVKPA